MAPPSEVLMVNSGKEIGGDNHTCNCIVFHVPSRRNPPAKRLCNGKQQALGKIPASLKNS
ncbi:hypothetical protein PCANC_19247 [Puccinia coronata f. sp. avenae]|uniref:Uncharacterized protein n=1 Tax=Puccinia coronata f. sp. avenae TaxID=200324 RepID=A0A2N5UFF8_9BASI|nr:hypothetical protein PCANC_19247 [Puccinia coronata f. sp. avenae]